MRTRAKVIWVCVGIILIGSLIALWPKRGACPLVITVSHAERVKYIGDGSVVQRVTICASNQSDSLPEIHVASMGIEFRVTDQWFKAQGAFSQILGKGGRCETEILVPAEADGLRVGLEYFQGKPVFRGGKLVFRRDNALDWILAHTKNRIPDGLWQWIDEHVSPRPKRVSLEVVIPPQE